MTMLDAALAYALNGWPVFPCSPENKRPLVTGGFLDASTDPATIRSWWSRWPRAMIGVPTGRTIGAFVVDLDLGEPRLITGRDYLARLADHLGGLPPTAISETGSGGYHVWFQWDDARDEVRNGANVSPALHIPAEKPAKGAQVDVRGEGGYVIVPPSVRSDGRAYTWCPGPEDGIAEASAAVWHMVLKGEIADEKARQAAAAPPIRTGAGVPVTADERLRKYALSALDGEIRALTSALPGTRGETLNRVAFALGQLVGAGALSESVVIASLREACAANGLAGTDGWKRTEAAIARGLAAGIDTPRDLSSVETSRAPVRREVADNPAAPPPEDAPDGAPPSSPRFAGEPGEDDGYDDGALSVDADDIDWELVATCAAEPQNDIGNSRRLRHRHGDNLIHVQNIGWYVHAGPRWEEDVDDCRTRPLAHQTAEAIHLEALLLPATAPEQAAIEAGEAALARLDAIKTELAEPLGGDDKSAREARDRRLKSEREALQEAVNLGREALKSWNTRKAGRRRFANTSGNTGKLDGMLREASAYLSKPVGALDAEPTAVNLENGTLRFVSAPDPECPDPDIERLAWAARLDDHRREDFISKIAPVPFDATAVCPQFDAFIARILPNLAVRGFVQRYFGYAMTALTTEQVFALLHGEGKNGKSTLVDVVSRILGDYATSVPIATLVGDDRRKGAEATPDLVRLPGARLVRSAEPKEGLAFDESLIKSLTSGEPILVRRLNQEFVEVYPTFKLVISANRKPTIKGNDDGIWRRVRLVPFDVQIPDAEIDKALSDKLWSERSGILNWLVAGALDFLRRGGLDAPPEVMAATQEYRDESDPMAAFVRSAIEITRNPYDKEEAGALYDAYAAWCRREGTTPFQPNTFARRMPKTAQQFGFEKAKASVSIYTGIQIRSEFRHAPSHTHTGG